jgi:hypothetical protein
MLFRTEKVTTTKNAVHENARGKLLTCGESLHIKREFIIERPDGTMNSEATNNKSKEALISLQVFIPEHGAQSSNNNIVEEQESHLIGVFPEVLLLIIFSYIPKERHQSEEIKQLNTKSHDSQGKTEFVIEVLVGEPRLRANHCNVRHKSEKRNCEEVAFLSLELELCFAVLRPRV